MSGPDDMAGAAAAADGPGRPPEAAAQIFGQGLPLAEVFAGMLAGPGVERGLIGPAEAGRIWNRHLLNCAVVAELVPDRCLLADLGSGAGLPGIVLAILRPQSRVILVEPMARRTTFLEECVAGLGLSNVTVRRARAEELAGQVGADVVTARAVASLDRLAGLATGLARAGGVVLAMKGATAAAEIERARPALSDLGARQVEILSLGDGTLTEPATVVRFVVGPRASADRRGQSRGTHGRSTRTRQRR